MRICQSGCAAPCTIPVAEEIGAAFDDPLVEVPERLQTFFAHAVYDLDGLDIALG